MQVGGVLLVAIFAVAIAAPLIWSAIGVASALGRGRPPRLAHCVAATASLMMVAAGWSLYLLIDAGLSHSERAKHAVLSRSVAAFVLVAVVPGTALFIARTLLARKRGGSGAA